MLEVFNKEGDKKFECETEYELQCYLWGKEEEFEGWVCIFENGKFRGSTDGTNPFVKVN